MGLEIDWLLGLAPSTHPRWSQRLYQCLAAGYWCLHSYGGTHPVLMAVMAVSCPGGPKYVETWLSLCADAR